LVVLALTIVAVIALRNREKVPVEIDAGLLAFSRGDAPRE
jgi:hypothetical protein